MYKTCGTLRCGLIWLKIKVGKLPRLSTSLALQFVTGSI
jgi:hypothetical protein